MFFTQDDRNALIAITQSFNELKIKYDMFFKGFSNIIDNLNNDFDKIYQQNERIISRLDLFIKEFETILPLVSGIKNTLQEVQEHCKSTKKKK